MMKVNKINLNKRYIGSLIILPIILSLLLGGVFLKTTLCIITLIAILEFSNALNNIEIKINKYLLLAFTIIYYVFELKYETLTIYLFFIIIMFFILQKGNNIVSISLTCLAIFYIIIPFGFIFKLYNMSIYIPWIVFLSAWSNDTMAYFIGKHFGKHKLNERLSPNKTIEGSIAGIISCIVVLVLYGFLSRNYFEISIVHFIMIGLLTGITGQVGDLIASSIKRYVNVKDYGTLIPGHGGILDRFDSILMISVTVYAYFIILL